jgi:hypothetical protein
MSSDIKENLSAFRKDLSRLTREVEDLSASLRADSRLVGEEAVGAELLASRNVVAQLSGLWDTAEQLGDLYVQQLRYWLEDHAETLSEAVRGTPARGGAGLLGRHLERRLAHITEGATAAGRLLSSQSAMASRTVWQLWKPFLDVMDRDWAGQRKRHSS